MLFLSKLINSIESNFRSPPAPLIPSALMVGNFESRFNTWGNNFLMLKKDELKLLFSFRYASPDRLNRISAQLHGWEMDFHNNNHNEVTKCWRLHLGSSDILKSFLISFKGGLISKRIFDSF